MGEQPSEDMHRRDGPEPAAPGPSGGPPWWRSSRTKLLAGAGAVLVTVVGGVLTTSVSSWLHPAPAPHTPSAAVRVLNPTTTMPASPTSGATVTPKATRPPYTGPKGAGWSVGGVPTLLQGDLLTVKAVMDPGASCTGGQGWAFAQPVGELAPLPISAAANADTWAAANGGTPASGNFITLDVQSVPGHPVIIDALGVRVVSRDAHTARTLPQLSGGCGGLVPSLFDVDLDRGAVVRAVSGTDAAGRTTEPVPFPHRLDDADPSEQWHLSLRTTTCTCAVIPYLAYTSGGQAATVELTNRGGPWRVAAVKGAALADRTDDQGRWTAYGTVP